MRYLVDTQLLIWHAVEPHRLSQQASAVLSETQSTMGFSSASIWETAIKRMLNKPGFDVDPRQLRSGLLSRDFQEIAVTSEHALAVLDLPSVHHDPFDRILIAQARVEEITLLTVDKTIARYPGLIRRV